MPKVSVIIPTRNRPALLRRALNSVFHQTFQDFEVLVVDDGQAPSAAAAVGDFLDQPNFRYLETAKNTGGAAARNLGIQAAAGQYLAFLDDDDEWQPEKLARQVAALDQVGEDVSLVFTGVAAYDVEGKQLYTRQPGESGVTTPLPRLLHKCYIWTSALMYRRSYADRGFVFDQTLTKNQEWDLELRLGEVSRFYAINEPLTRINIGESEQMGSRKNLPNIISGHEKFLTKHHRLYEAVPRAYALRLFHLGYLYWEAGNSRRARDLWLRSWRLNKVNLIPLKHWLAIGWGKGGYRLFKNWYRQTTWARRRLFQRDAKRAQVVLARLFPDRPESGEILRHFCRSPFFHRHFSHGHAGDFDIMMLYALTRLTTPAVVVETGVASGRSSAAILTALAENRAGRLYSIDRPQYYASTAPETYATSEGNTELRGFVPIGREPGWLVDTLLRDRWELIIGDSRDELPKLLKRLDEIDIFYHDSEHSYQSMMFEFSSVWPRLAVGGWLLSDDIKWNKSWSDFMVQAKPDKLDNYRGFGLARKA